MIGRVPIKPIPLHILLNNKVFSIDVPIYPRSYVTRSHGTLTYDYVTVGGETHKWAVVQQTAWVIV